MKRIILFLLYVLFRVCSINAQDCNGLQRLGIAIKAKEKGDYQDALNIYFTVVNCDKHLEDTVQKEIRNMFREIDGLRKKEEKAAKDAKNAELAANKAKVVADSLRLQANKDKNEAIRLQKVAEDAQIKTEEQRKIANDARTELESANKTNQRIVNASYFYKEKYALAYQNGKYGFIDKTGEPLIPYTYDHALPFDETLGWALVKKAGKEYYLDTSGAEYLLVRDLNYLDDKVSALDLSNRDLKAIPAEVLSNKQLKYVNLSGNQIETIPSGLFDNLTSLVHLNVSNNRLKVLPVGAKELPQLKTLNLSHNQFSSLSTSFERLIKLEELNLSDNLLTELPESIQKLQALKVLDVSENKLNTLPAWVGQLQQLTKLYLQNNNLKTLPAEIGNLHKLKDLNLSFNLLNNLPGSFGQLAQLDLLDISFNTLEQLPAGIKAHLFFNCSGNRLKERPNVAKELGTRFWGTGNPFKD